MAIIHRMVVDTLEENEVFDPITGEILDKKSKKKVRDISKDFVPLPYYSEPKKYEVGDPKPLAVVLERVPRDIRDILRESGIPKFEPENPDSSSPLDLGNPEDDDDEEFNNALGNTPYACDDMGVSNMEKVLASTDEERAQFNDWLSKKDNPAFQKLLTMSEAELLALQEVVTSPKPDEPDGVVISEAEA